MTYKQEVKLWDVLIYFFVDNNCPFSRPVFTSVGIGIGIVVNWSLESAYDLVEIVDAYGDTSSTGHWSPRNQNVSSFL